MFQCDVIPSIELCKFDASLDAGNPLMQIQIVNSNI